jgi:hypothetical protein
MSRFNGVAGRETVETVFGIRRPGTRLKPGVN